jgi:transcriptional regulator with XRE-family HTH domain
MTQADLAARLDDLGHGQISQTAIARLENGKRAVRIDELYALSFALGVSPVHLLTPLDDQARVKLARNLTMPAPLVRAWLRGWLTRPVERPESELRADLWRDLTRGMQPLTVNLVRDRLEEELERRLDEIHNPKEGTDG